MAIIDMSNEEYQDYHYMRSTIKNLVVSSLSSMYGDGFVADHKSVIYKLVEDASQKVLVIHGKPSRSEYVIINAYRFVIAAIQNMPSVKIRKLRC